MIFKFNFSCLTGHKLEFKKDGKRVSMVVLSNNTKFPSFAHSMMKIKVCDAIIE